MIKILGTLAFYSWQPGARLFTSAQFLPVSGRTLQSTATKAVLQNEYQIILKVSDVDQRNHVNRRQLTVPQIRSTDQ